MVLVVYKPNSDIGILQTKLSHREGHEARRMGLEAMPLDQHIKSRHGEREAGAEILPLIIPNWQMSPTILKLLKMCHENASS